MKEIEMGEISINRRHMLKALGCCGAAVLLSGCKAAEDSYSVSDGKKTLCPYGAVNDPYPGSCLAYKDADGDGICDCSLVIGVAGNAAIAQAAGSSALNGDFVSQCPFGYQYDPYPGRCDRYKDSDSSGYCDYSEPTTAASSTQPTAETASTQVAPTAQAATQASGTGTVACPFGRTNDPYPGLCQRYVDSDGSGYCDYSEIQISVNQNEVGVVSGSAVNAASAGLTTDFIPTCPYGYQYDPYPGRCGRYIDTDGSGYCDRSEPIGATLQGSGGQGNGGGNGWHGQNGNSEHDDD